MTEQMYLGSYMPCMMSNILNEYMEKCLIGISSFARNIAKSAMPEESGNTKMLAFYFNI